MKVNFTFEIIISYVKSENFICEWSISQAYSFFLRDIIIMSHAKCIFPAFIPCVYDPNFELFLTRISSQWMKFKKKFTSKSLSLRL